MGLFDKQDGVVTSKPLTTDEVGSVDPTKKPKKGELTKKAQEERVKKEKLEEILAYLEKSNAPAEIMEAAKIVRPSYFGLGGIGGYSPDTTAAQKKIMACAKVDAFDKLKVGMKFTAMDVFEAIGEGRKAMTEIIRLVIKNPASHKALWIAYDEMKKEYEIKGIGDMPNNWEGYVPTENVEA